MMEFGIFRPPSRNFFLENPYKPINNYKKRRNSGVFIRHFDFGKSDDRFIINALENAYIPIIAKKDGIQECSSIIFDPPSLICEIFLMVKTFIT